jgi:hypothetical protein
LSPGRKKLAKALLNFYEHSATLAHQIPESLICLYHDEDVITTSHIVFSEAVLAQRISEPAFMAHKDETNGKIQN